ncbi:FAD-dependent oxidoreductase [Thermoplasmatota archaeon]
MNYDYIIIGSGIIGSSTGFHLKRLNPNLNILIIEKNQRSGFGNTSKSAALYRNLFSSKTSRQLAISSIYFYNKIAENIKLQKSGYLWLFSEEQWNKNKNIINKFEKDKLEIEIFNKEEIQKYLNINFFSTDKLPDIKKGIFCKNCGSLSAVALAEYYTNSFVESGGKIIFNKEIKSIKLSGEKELYPPWAEIKIRYLIDNNSDKYYSNNYVFATGAWTQNILSSIGIASNIYPKKRQLFGLRIKNSLNMFNRKDEQYPAIILPAGGVYIKPILKENTIIVGCADDLGQPYILSDFNANPQYFNKAIKPVLSHYFPSMKGYKLYLKWAGYYAYHWPDKSPVIENVSNITWVSGTSGSGIMKADAIGRITASKLIGDKYATLADQSRFKVSNLSLYQRKVDLEKLII